MLESEFVDQFFRDGTLRISSFQHFRGHADEERQDTAEGSSGFVTVRDRNGGENSMYAGSIMGPGNNCYVLCGTTMFDPALCSAFGTNSGFRINDTTAFAAAISSHIPGFTAGTEGGCLYMNNRSIERDIGPISAEDFIKNLASETEPDKTDLTKMMGFFSDLAGDDFYFAKQTRFAHQNEYRMIWFTPSTSNSFIDIKCPEARNFCVRFEDLWDLHEKKLV